MVEMFLGMVMVVLVTAAASKPRQDMVNPRFTAVLSDMPDEHPH